MRGEEAHPCLSSRDHDCAGTSCNKGRETFSGVAVTSPLQMCLISEFIAAQSFFFF